MTESQPIPTANLDPAEVARTIATTPDEQLAEGMRSEMRGQILDEIFSRMEEHFDAAKAGSVDAVIHWKILGRPDGGEDLYELIVRGGACKLSPEPAEQPRVTFAIDSVAFLRLVTGNASGPDLFMQGKLKIEGDLMFAAQVAGLFKVPQAAA
ncbi:MAG TPA: SCP2 sterol-binding domain-containing protein [Solirubrobacteraceae bacterium]|nr:SCP2 sterol-binding domain-containing protein [Solirubrobacteraceae bacterium]